MFLEKQNCIWSVTMAETLFYSIIYILLKIYNCINVIIYTWNQPPLKKAIILHK